MRAQKPAEGILKTNDWGDSKIYYIACDCSDDDHSHIVEVEANDYDVSVHIYVKVHTKWCEKNRWKQIWQILTKGYAEMETSILMKEQTALNYSEVLKQATNDVKEFKKITNEKRSTT